jgi:hypothetical protein
VNARETVNMSAQADLHNLLFYRLHDGGALCVAALRMLTKDEWRRLIRLIDVQADLGIMAELRALKAQERGTGDGAKPAAVDEQAQQIKALKAEHEAALEDLQAQLNAVAKDSDGHLGRWKQAEQRLSEKDMAIAHLRGEIRYLEKQLPDRQDSEAAWRQAEADLEQEIALHSDTRAKAEALQARLDEIEGRLAAPVAESETGRLPGVRIEAVADLEDEADAPAPDALVSEGEAVEIADAMAPVIESAPEVVEAPVEPSGNSGTFAEADEPAGNDLPRASSGGVAPPRAALDLSSGVHLLLPRSLFGIAEAMLARPCLMADLAKLTASGNIGTTAANVSLLRREVKRQTGAAWAVVREGELYRLARVKPAAPAAAAAPKAEQARPAAEAIRPAPYKPLTGAVPIEPGDLIGVNIKIGVVATPAGQYSLDGATKMARTLDLLKGGAMFGLAHIATVGQWRDAETARNALLMERGRLARHGIDIYTDKLNARLRTLEAGA